MGVFFKIFFKFKFQMREARRIEQSHNPNYLKVKSTKKNKNEERKDDLDDIPIQEISLDVPIKITCKSSGVVLCKGISNNFCL